MLKSKIMETRNEKTIAAISELAEFVNDGVMGYQRGADGTKDQEIKTFCLNKVTERQQFLSELNGFLMQQGGKPETSGTIKGAIYRQWMAVKAALTGADDEAMINACAYGEEWALKAYDDALENQELPLEIRQTLEMQRQECKHAYNELHEMKSYHHS
jgi:uncharacterized protein (TIGR02284 family)